MLSYLIKRVLAAIPVGFGVVIVVALLIHTIPGDPVDIILGEYATKAEKDLLYHHLGLDKPLWEQCYLYLKGLMTGDLQTSLIYNRPVTELIADRLWPTLELATLAIITAICFSIPLGILSALNKGKTLDFIAMATSLLGVAMPTFWLGPMFVLFFSLHLGLLPVSERSGFSSYILPALTLGTALAALLARMTRNAMLEIFKEDYMRTARAKGAPEWLVIGKHALRNAALPLISILGLQFGTLLTGAVITEKIFDWPGLGSLLLEGLGQRDYPLVQGCVLFFSLTYLGVNLLTDLAYALIDPRIALAKGPSHASKP